MATREELMAFLNNYLTSQATDPSWYYTSSPAELETLYKDYVKSQYDIKGDYSTVVDKYSMFDPNDSQIQKMFGLFRQIRDKNMTAADIIEQQGDLLGPGQKQDLETYENEIYAIEKFEQETLADQRANAEIYGLPMPDASAYIPPLEMLQGFEPVQKGGMTELATSQRWQRDAQKKYAEAMAAYNASVAGDTSKPVVSGDEPDKGFVRPNARIIGERTTGRVGGERTTGRVGGKKTTGRVTGERTRTSGESDEKKKEALWARNTAYTTKRAAELRVQQDSTFTERLAGEIAKQMVQKYGTPYDAALKKARELAEEEARKKAEGRGN